MAVSETNFVTLNICSERRRRYKVIKEHGLLVANRTMSWLSKYSEALGCSQNSNGKTNHAGRFIAFMQLTSGIGFDSIVEALQYAHDLKKYVFRCVANIITICSFNDVSNSRNNLLTFILILAQTV